MNKADVFSLCVEVGQSVFFLLRFQQPSRDMTDIRHIMTQTHDWYQTYKDSDTWLTDRTCLLDKSVFALSNCEEEEEEEEEEEKWEELEGRDRLSWTNTWSHDLCAQTAKMLSQSLFQHVQWENICDTLLLLLFILSRGITFPGTIRSLAFLPAYLKSGTAERRLVVISLPVSWNGLQLFIKLLTYVPLCLQKRAHSVIVLRWVRVTAGTLNSNYQKKKKKSADWEW